MCHGLELWLLFTLMLLIKQVRINVAIDKGSLHVTCDAFVNGTNGTNVKVVLYYHQVDGISKPGNRRSLSLPFPSRWANFSL